MTKEQIEEERLRQLKKKLVSNARAILSNQIGLPFGVEKMTKILTWIKNIQPLDIDVKIFEDYYNGTSGMPLGPERLQWNIDSLKKEDKKLNELTDKFRDDILDKCSELIKTYGQ